MTSVDDDAGWLEKTSGYLALEGMRAGRLLTWEELLGGDVPRFDLILHDPGDMARRAQALDRVLELLGPAGVLVLDDMHSPTYGSRVRDALESRGLSLYSLRSWTLDRFGRYASLAVAAP